ncbi:hypothetical protein BH23CHL7_BH23CHL7_08610 [soil metagenome]
MVSGPSTYGRPQRGERHVQDLAKASPPTWCCAHGALRVATLVAAPVAADLELGHKGHVGYHALIDTQTKPGASCIYRTTTERDSDNEPGMIYWEGRLARLEVRPPVMRSGRP